MPLPPDFLRDTPTLAILGVAKNSGKTTTLAALLAREPEPVGLLSVGIDGESQDFLLGTDKPAVPVKCGDLVVTAQGAMAYGQAQLQYLEPLGFDTPLGPVVLTRVLTPGSVMLAGMRHRGDLVRAVDMLQDHGAARVFVDGAYGRMVAGHTQVSDGIVLATGAVLGGGIKQVVAKTLHILRRFLLPPVTLAWHRELLGLATSQSRSLLGHPGGQRPLPAPSALLGLPSLAGSWTPEDQAIAIPGLVSDRVVTLLLATPMLEKKRTLLLPDATLIHCAEALLTKLLDRWDVRLGHVQRLLGVSLNPTALGGVQLDSGALEQALGQALPEGVAVFDPKGL